MTNFEEEIAARCVLVTTSTDKTALRLIDTRAYLLCDENKERVIEYADWLHDDVRRAQKDMNLRELWNRIPDYLIPYEYTDNNVKYLPQVQVKQKVHGMEYLAIISPNSRVWFDRIYPFQVGETE